MVGSARKSSKHEVQSSSIGSARTRLGSKKTASFHHYSEYEGLWLPFFDTECSILALFFFHLGERYDPALPSNSPYKVTATWQPAIAPHLLRLNVHFHFFITRWECPMICTTLSTICGWRTNPSGSFLDKHMPWISGHQHLHQLTSCTRRTTQTPQTSCRARHQAEFSHSSRSSRVEKCLKKIILCFHPNQLPAFGKFEALLAQPPRRAGC